MDTFNVSTKPNLIDSKIMMQLEMKRSMAQMGGNDAGVCSKVWTKFQSDMSSFFYNNFWVLLIIGFIVYLLWRRYKWYQKTYIKEREREKEKQKLKVKHQIEKEKEKKLRMKILLDKQNKQSEKKEVKEIGAYDKSSYAMY